MITHFIYIYILASLYTRCIMRVFKSFSIFFYNCKNFIDYNSRLMHFSITKISGGIQLWIIHSPYSLFHYKFTASQVIEGFSFSYLFFYLAFDISTYITTIHQGEKKNKNLKKEKKNKKMSCHVGKPKPFFLIHLINLHISQKVDHLSKKNVTIYS